MSQKTNNILKTLHIVSWMLFIGVCIEAGGFIFNAFSTLLIDPIHANKFWLNVDLSELYQNNQSQFITVIFLMIVVAFLRAVMFYMIVKLFNNKKLHLSKPFNEDIQHFILNIAYLALAIGLFSFCATLFTQKLVHEGISIPDLQYLRLAGADVWLFMGIALLIIAYFFKKAIELQNENDLTV
ncbi:MAG: DUF2975 domain-containing protein [Xanthomarina sp.]